jgi:hypothetical protein
MSKVTKTGALEYWSTGIIKGAPWSSFSLGASPRTAAMSVAESRATSFVSSPRFLSATTFAFSLFELYQTRARTKSCSSTSPRRSGILYPFCSRGLAF